MNERIKEIRMKLNLTQTELGNRIGVTRAAVSRIESGERNVTDQVFLSICREFGVTEHWLRTGEGEMFIDLPPEDEYIKAAAEISKDPDDEIIRQAIIEYWKLNEDGKRYLKEFLYNIANSIKKEE